MTPRATWAAVRTCLVLLCGALAAGAARAQAPAAGQLEREFAPPPALPAGEGPSVPATPRQQPPPDADQVRFTLRQVEVTGNTVLPALEVAAAWAPLKDREVSLADVFRLADDLTAQFRNQGYVLTRAIVPPQNIREGVVRLQVVEGHVARTQLAGASAGPREQLEQHLAVIRASRPLSAGVLERELLLMNDLPGVSARATIAPSQTPAASDLTVDIAERRAAFSAGVNNRGSRSLGPWRADLSADWHQLLAGYDRLSLRLIRTLADDELTFASLGYERVLGASGARVGLALSHAEAEPGRTQNVNLPTRSRSATLHASWPWLRSRAESLTLRASLGVLRSQTDLAAGGGAIGVSEDRISAARLGASWSLVDRFRGLSVIDVELSHGLDAFDASSAGDPALSIAGGRPDFTKLTLYAARLQSLAPRWSLLAALNVQAAPHVLLSPERFAFGGEQFGRAYDSAELTGDAGAALKLELRYTDSVPASSWWRDVTLYGFYEAGRVHRRAAGAGSSRHESASNAGLGLRFSLQRVLTGYAEVAQPLTREVSQEGNDDARVFVGVQGTF